VEPQRLLAQAQRVADVEADTDLDDGPAAAAGTIGNSVHAALGVLFGEFEPDEIASRHKEFGLEEGDSTLWVTASDEPAEPGEWLDAPFDLADPQRVVCRFDVSAVFDDELDGDLSDEGVDGSDGVAEATDDDLGRPDADR